MFTGIIKSTASVVEINKGEVLLQSDLFQEDFDLGASIAVNGVCLSIVFSRQATG